MVLKRVLCRALLGAALVAGLAIAAPGPEAHAAVFITAAFAPPAIPIYTQPLCPGDGYIWTPGYWAWDGTQYYWVEGAWVLPPYVGGLWTPGWWGWGTGGYFWHPGYWGRTVGYYGGINYGYGYFGVGFYGGYWNSGRFWYNSAYGHFGSGFRGAVYNHSYAGFAGRPGGPAFNAHPAGYGAPGSGFNHPSAINGRDTSSGNRGYLGGYDHVNGLAGGSGFNGSPRSYTSPAGNYGRGYSAPSGTRSYSAPSGANHPFSGGGGFHGGGGGSSHGSGGHR